MKTLATSDLQAFSAEVSSYSQRLGLGLEFGDSTEKGILLRFLRHLVKIDLRKDLAPSQAGWM